MATDERLFVRPLPGGAKVRRPQAPFTHVPAEGMHVPAESYWLRRIADGDLVLGDEAQQKEETR